MSLTHEELKAIRKEYDATMLADDDRTISLMAKAAINIPSLLAHIDEQHKILSEKQKAISRAAEIICDEFCGQNHHAVCFEIHAALP